MKRLLVAMMMVMLLCPALVTPAHANYAGEYYWEQGESWTASWGWQANRFSWSNGVMGGLEAFAFDKQVFTVGSGGDLYEAPWLMVTQASQGGWSLTSGTGPEVTIAGGALTGGETVWYTHYFEGDPPSTLWVRSYYHNELVEIERLELSGGTSLTETAFDYHFGMPSDVPEPSTLLLLPLVLAGAGVLAAVRRRK